MTKNAIITREKDSLSCICIKIMKRCFHPKQRRPEAGFYSAFRTNNNLSPIIRLPEKNLFFFISPRRFSTSSQLFKQMQRNKIGKVNIWL